MFLTSPFVCYQSYEHDILKTNEPISSQIGTSSLQGKALIIQLDGSGDQRCEAHGHMRLKLDL